MIAGLAVAAGTGARVGALATAYVLILVIIGPLAARYTEPVVRLLARTAAPAPGPPAAGKQQAS